MPLETHPSIINGTSMVKSTTPEIAPSAIPLMQTPPSLPAPLDFYDAGTANIKAVLQHAELSPDVMSYIFDTLLKPNAHFGLLTQYSVRLVNLLQVCED